MKKLARVAAVALALVGASARAEAVPVLQLDIVGGYYDPVTQTIVSNGPNFTLVALLTPRIGGTSAATLLAEQYFLSVALTPQTGPAPATLGSFSLDGTAYDVTGDMTYGVPPLEGVEASFDGGDLGQHSIYPTYFSEFMFTFDAANTSGVYNTADDPGGPYPSGTGSFYRTFDIAMSLPGEYQLHFDLYDTKVREKCNGRTGSCLTDEDIDRFAPFSHDAESAPPVPEPASLLLLGGGIGAGVLRRWRRRQTA